MSEDKVDVLVMVQSMQALNKSMTSLEGKVERLSSLDIDTLNKMASGYKGIAFLSGVVVGFAGVMLAGAALAKGAIYIIRTIK
jgi:hypothetical protein